LALRVERVEPELRSRSLGEDYAGLTAGADHARAPVDVHRLWLDFGLSLPRKEQPT
jgi:hypothetical protein